jgi:hypothetical protein
VSINRTLTIIFFAVFSFDYTDAYLLIKGGGEVGLRGQQEGRPKINLQGYGIYIEIFVKQLSLKHTGTQFNNMKAQYTMKTWE